jgi:competence ComEA-like helix-hairpin-helix protein
MKLSVLVLGAMVCAGWAAGDDEEARNLPGGAGKDAVVKVCLSCHGAGNFRQLRLNKDGWSDKVADMVDKGAEASDAEVAAVIGYLAEQFGPDSKINVNTAPFQELKAVLKLTAKETQAMVDYRQEKGRFQAVAEMEQIPGVPAEKIEAAKERIAF